MSWDLCFISKEDLTHHVHDTIRQYGRKLLPYDLKKFNNNLIDPIKLLFDKTVYSTSWEELINQEIFRQRDKANNNDIGYFHQNIFKYIADCTVPTHGWDVIYTGGNLHTKGISTVYVEMKNKHNTMNSASSAKTYTKMEHQLLHDDSCACFLVEAIAKRSQNTKWTTRIDGEKRQHKLIRRVSIDQFYALVTGDEKAFYRLCLVLPEIISEVVSTNTIQTPHDTVMEELIASGSDDLSIAMSVYMLGFSSYLGFKDL